MILSRALAIALYGYGVSTAQASPRAASSSTELEERFMTEVCTGTTGTFAPQSTGVCEGDASTWFSSPTTKSCDDCPTVHFSPVSLYGEAIIGDHKVACHLAVDLVETGGKTFIMKPEGHKPVFKLLESPETGTTATGAIGQKPGWCMGHSIRVAEVPSDGSVNIECNVRLNPSAVSPRYGACQLTTLKYPAVAEARCGEVKLSSTDPDEFVANNFQGTQNKIPAYKKNFEKPWFRINRADDDVLLKSLTDGCKVLMGCKCFDSISYTYGDGHKAVFFDPDCNDCLSTTCGDFTLNEKCSDENAYDTVVVNKDSCTVPNTTVGIAGNSDVGITCTEVTISASGDTNVPPITFTAIF